MHRLLLAERLSPLRRITFGLSALFSAATLLLTASAAPLGPDAEDAQVPNEDAVVSLARAYARGDADAAVAEMVTAWIAGPPGWSIARQATRQADRERVRDDLHRGGMLGAAIALHTETALWLWKEQRPRAALDHLAVAREWLDDASGDFSRSWLLAVFAFFQAEMASAETADLVEWATARFPDVPDVWLAQGIIEETAASALETASRTSAKDRPSRELTFTFDRSDLKASLDQWVPRWQALMANADKAYGAALLRAPADPDALLRRGWVLTRLGRLADGAALITRADAATSDTNIRFLAALFLARNFEAQDRMAEAESAYVRARQLSPGAPSATIGLARLHLQQGQRQRAQAVVHSLFEAGDANDADPWWLFDRGLAGRLPQALRTLRQLARHE